MRSRNIESSVNLWQPIVTLANHKSSMKLEGDCLARVRLWVRQLKTWGNLRANVAKESRTTSTNVWSRVRQLGLDTLGLIRRMESWSRQNFDKASITGSTIKAGVDSFKLMIGKCSIDHSVTDCCGKVIKTSYWKKQMVELWTPNTIILGKMQINRALEGAFWDTYDDDEALDFLCSIWKT